MKVSRQTDLQETNKITCDWLDQFARGLAKSANLEYLDPDKKATLENASKFRTIEAKMEDIKTRIGFEKLMFHNKQEITATSIEFNNEVKIAKIKHTPEDIAAMKQILEHIAKIMEHEPHLDATAIINRCRQEDGLRFLDLPIDVNKLRRAIDKKLSKDESAEIVNYVPTEPINSGEAEDTNADYYRHSEITT